MIVNGYVKMVPVKDVDVCSEIRDLVGADLRSYFMEMKSRGLSHRKLNSAYRRVSQSVVRLSQKHNSRFSEAEIHQLFIAAVSEILSYFRIASAVSSPVSVSVAVAKVVSELNSVHGLDAWNGYVAVLRMVDDSNRSSTVIRDWDR